MLLRVATFLIHDDLTRYFGLEQRLLLLIVHGWTILLAAALICELSGRSGVERSP